MKSILASLSALLIISFTPGIVLAQTNIEDGEVTGTWTKAGSPYLIGGEINVPPDGKLVIEPGSRIEFFPTNYFVVQGSLVAEGTESDPIVFSVPDTTGAWDLENFTGFWGGVRLIHYESQQDSSIFSYCKFEYSKAESMQNNLDNGGAMTIENNNRVRISHCLFENNTSSGGDQESGGALYIGGSLNIKVLNNTFRNNSAREGGAVYIAFSKAYFDGNIIDGCKAVLGGAYCINGSEVSIHADSIISNRADEHGGDIQVKEQETASLVFFSETTFKGNKANGNGGAIESTHNNLFFTDCSFLSNESAQEGGAMFINIENSNLDLQNCEFMSNNAEGRGAIRVMHGRATMHNCQFVDNTSETAVAVMGIEFCHTTITECSFSSNISDTYGALSIDHCKVELTDCTFSDNNGQNGGAIYGEFCTTSIKNTSFDSNSGTWGGACKFQNSNLEIEDCSFSNNECWGEAGAIHFTTDPNGDEPGDLSLKGSDFVNNISHHQYSCIYVNQNGASGMIESIMVDACLFEDNESSENGAFRIMGDIDNVKISNSKFIGNLTHSNRSIVGVHTNCNAKILNCLFIDNQPRAMIIHDSAEADIINCTFTGSEGTALDLRGGAVGRIANSIFWNNGRPAALNTAADLGCTLTMKYCDVQYGKDSVFLSDDQSEFFWGEGNITDDPRFFNPVLDDYSLYYDSPCLEAGSLAMVYDGIWLHAPETDIKGDPRPLPVDTNPDMGAYESSVLAGTDKWEDHTDPLKLLNYPNPFSSTTCITWNQPQQSHVQLSIYDIYGRKVSTLLDQQMPSGTVRVYFDGTRVPDGIYIASLILDNRVISKKIKRISH